MKLILPKDSTSVSVDIFVQNSSVSTGAGLTGLVYNSASLTAYYRRPGGSATAITLATLASATAAYSSGGFVEISSSNMPGWYRLDIPDAVLATGVNYAYIALKGATNMAPVNIEIQLSNLNLNDGVRAGLTALPNAAAEASGGLVTRGTGTGQLSVSGGRANADTVYWNGSAVATPTVAGVPEVDVTHWIGTAAATPTTAGVPEVDITYIAGAAVNTSSAQIGVNVVNAAGTAWNSGAIGASTIADAAIDRATFAADTGLQTVRSNTAQAGASTTITLDSSASAVNDFYNDAWITITGGTGSGQTRQITDYVGSTKVATVATWATTPDNTSTFAVLRVNAVATTVSDKTGYKLASDGLDSVSTTAPSGVASNFREMLVQTWRHFFKKSTMSTTQIKTYADDGTTVITTQTISDTGTLQTRGAAS